MIKTTTKKSISVKLEPLVHHTGYIKSIRWKAQKMVDGELRWETFSIVGHFDGRYRKVWEIEDCFKNERTGEKRCYTRTELRDAFKEVELLKYYG